MFHPLRALVTSLALIAGSIVMAAPSQVAVAPPEGARFMSGQRFDLRVEGAGTGPFAATLRIDGVVQTFTSGAPGMTTDGITSPGFGGFNLRGYSSSVPGWHEVSATFTDATGTAEVASRFQILPLRGSKHGIKNIILMLGDGMGIAHRTAARIVRYGVTGGQPDGLLEMDRFPGTGFVITHSLNSIVTDSAPGMSSYSTGSHAKNGQEGVYPAHVVNPFFYPRVEYLSEYLHRTKGTALGLVTTADVEDATPAANAVHTGDRGAGTGICDQYLDEADATDTRARGTGLAVLMGGGRRWFVPAPSKYSSRGNDTDYPALPADLRSAWRLPEAGGLDASRDLRADFERQGFAYADSAAALTAALAARVPPKLLGLFAWGNMNAALDKVAKRRGAKLSESATFAVDDFRAPDQPMLDEMTDAALKVLALHKEGFVLLVEGAHIDKQSHLMDADRAIGEVLELDRAVGVARRFAQERTDTLVLVIADHETAGFSLIGALTGGVDALRRLSSDSGALRPADAPARQKVVGTYDSAGFPRYRINAQDGYPEAFDMDGKLLVGFGANANRTETWLTPARPAIDSLLPKALAAELGDIGYVKRPDERPDQADGFFVRGQTGEKNDNAVHTATDVPLSAYSRSNTWQRFVGVQTNTDVFFTLVRAALGDEEMQPRRQ